MSESTAMDTTTMAPEGITDTLNRERVEAYAAPEPACVCFPKARKRALKYIESFYDTINDPRKLENRIIGACR